MRAKITAFLGITLLMLAISALSTATVFAAGATKISGVMLAKDNSGDFDPGVDVGDVTVTINEGNFTVKIRTTGLVPGHMHSVWWEIVGEEGPFNLTGGMASGDGTGNYTGHFRSDVESGTLKLTIKDHGEVMPGDVPNQKHTSNLACNDPPGGCKSIQKAFIIFP